jgi:hypothetical protein
MLWRWAVSSVCGTVHVATFQRIVRKVARSAECSNVRTTGRDDMAPPRSEEKGSVDGLTVGFSPRRFLFTSAF